MKKALCVMLLALGFAVPAFSQLRMNGWGRAVWVPGYYYAPTQQWMSTVQASYGDEPDLEFIFSASSTNVGVDLGVLVQAAEFNQIGNAKIWWRTNEFFKLHVGLGRVPFLRGKVEGSTGAYSYARGRVTGLTAPSGKNEPILMINDGDGIFSRFNLNKMGAILEITPVDGLFIGAAVAPGFKLNAGTEAEDVYKGIHLAAGYEIKDVGLFRVGFIGGSEKDGKTGNAGENWDFSWDKRVEAAFALTGITDLVADLGFKYSLHKHPGILDQPGFSLENPLYVAFGILYSGVENLKLGLALDGHFAGTAKLENAATNDDTTTSAPQIAFNIYPTYNIGFCDLGLDITYGIQLGDVHGVNDRQMFGFGIHGQKQYGHGNIRIGVYANAPMNEGQDEWGLSFPVWVTYSF
jgi:hypothetical protein